MTLLEGTSRSVAGTTRFVRYAFMPNRLRYCGGDDNSTILEYATAGVREAPLVGMLRKFTGALPYLSLIARGNGIADPFDERVVEAYWLGSDLLDRVEARDLYVSLRERYQTQLSPKVMDSVAGKAPAGARPHHSFHVFDVWRHADRSGTDVLQMLDSCRVSWGLVRSVEIGELVVDRRHLELRDGRLELGEPRTDRVTRTIQGNGFAHDARPGDLVSIHWDWVCEIIDERQRAALERYTRHHLQLANATL